MNLYESKFSLEILIKIFTRKSDIDCDVMLIACIDERSQVAAASGTVRRTKREKKRNIKVRVKGNPRGMRVP